MPTNRKRKMRKLKIWIPQTFDKKYISSLRLKDFLGRLEPEEIPIAKSLGVFKFDTWAKERHQRRSGVNK